MKGWIYGAMKISIQLQQEYYDQKRAENFDKKRINSNHFYKIETIEDFFERYASDKKNLCVMELGGGTGIHAKHFLEKEADRVEKFIFSDLSQDMLSVAKKRLAEFAPKVRFLCSDAESYNLEQKLDCIYISGAMHHFANPSKAIENCREHLNPGGILVVCEPVFTNPYALPKIIFSKEEYGQFKVTSGNVKRWLLDSGFCILDERYLHYRSNHKCFRWLLNLENVKILNWTAVMFCIVAQCTIKK